MNCDIIAVVMDKIFIIMGHFLSITQKLSAIGQGLLSFNSTATWVLKFECTA